MSIAVKYPGSYRILLGSSTGRILLLRLSGLLHIRSETIYLLATNWLHPNRIFVGLPDRLLPAGSMGHWQSVDVVLPIALEPLFATRQIMPRYDQFVRPWKSRGHG